MTIRMMIGGSHHHTRPRTRAAFVVAWLMIRPSEGTRVGPSPSTSSPVAPRIAAEMPPVRLAASHGSMFGSISTNMISNADAPDRCAIRT